ncbi:hypothetical protein HZY97_08725 [Sphingomonas sp. R-74633]|uniref:hypothetical protein n=1 Tax=Sphingomonas sp. R-74633 TaxID=2751188 RepID=UPI0015D2927E|nr:hypothetical protein [Sphingomonas sp. R-74633]NYT40836.1 hypothetical protein [Sphingomonas sp. R-74633]
MPDLRAALEAASRPGLLRYLAGVIHGFTIMARDPDTSSERRAAINNCIHYIAGHLRGLSDPAAPLDLWRLDGILEQAARLNSGLAADLEAELRRPGA